MIIENIFGHDIIRIQCTDSELYRNAELTASVNQVFELPEVKKFNSSRGSQDGHGLTFVDHPYLSLQNLPGANPLMKWIAEQMIVDTKHKDVTFVRSWANRIFKDCTGILHNHHGYGHVDVTGILYVDVPDHGAELIFVRDGEPGKSHLDYASEDRYFLQPKPGELILHDSAIFHTVGQHVVDMTRTVFVFDAVYNS
jgi:hypothetical protein